MTLVRLGIALSFMCGIALSERFAQSEELIQTGTVTVRTGYGDRVIDIHPFASNLKYPAGQWQFRYKPLLFPEVKDGKLDVQKSVEGNEWIVSIRIWFDMPRARATAFDAVRSGYPGQASLLREANVGRIQISEVRFSLSHPKGKWQSEPFNPAQAQFRTVNIPARSKEDADIIEAWLRGTRGLIRIEYKYGTRSLKENSTVVTMEHLKNTRLHQQLDGLPKDKGMVYVHRDQLGKLSEGISGQIDRIDWVEKPDTFDSVVVDGLIHHWNSQLEIDFGKDWIRASMYNPQEIAPDRITRDFQKAFSYDASSRQYKVNVSGEAGVAIPVGPIPIPVSGSAKGSYSKEELETLFKQHSFEAELDGEMIKPKKLWLQIANTADFDSKNTVTNRRLYVGNPEVQSEVVDIELAEALGGGAVQRDLLSRVAELESYVSEFERGIKVDATTGRVAIKELAASQIVVEDGKAKSEIIPGEIKLASKADTESTFYRYNGWDIQWDKARITMGFSGKYSVRLSIFAHPSGASIATPIGVEARDP